MVARRFARQLKWARLQSLCPMAGCNLPVWCHPARQGEM